MNVEILEFVRPDQSENSLYISDISPKLEHTQLYEILYDRFSRFGLLYDINITDNVLWPQSDRGNVHAFVRFYSRRAAFQAKQSLSGRLFVAGHCMRVRFSTKPAPDNQVTLFYTKCYELANYYLGFNGWSLTITVCKENEDFRRLNADQVQYVCGVKLVIPSHAVSSEGYGVATASFNDKDVSTKAVAVCRAKKHSYQLAVQNAFSHVILVILNTDKIYVDMKNTAQDRVFTDDQLTVDNTLKVNDLDFDPSSEESSDEFNDSFQLDLVNEQLLKELEAENK